MMDLDKIYCVKDRVASRKIVDEVILSKSVSGVLACGCWWAS